MIVSVIGLYQEIFCVDIYQYVQQSHGDDANKQNNDACLFTVNLVPTPIDAMLTASTNESIALAGGQPMTSAANLYFSIGSSVLLTIVAAFAAARIIAPRLGEYTSEHGAAASSDKTGAKEDLSPEAETRGLRAALSGFLGVAAVILLPTLPPGAPLRRPDGQIGGNSPLMDSLLFVIMLFFLLSGIAFGKAAGTIKNSGDVIKAVTKTFAGLAGLVFILLMISQFIAADAAPGDILGTIQAAIDDANESYANSGIVQRMRLVHAAEVDYEESGDTVLDRDRLRDPGDGFMDGVHALRDTYGADLVSLFTASGNWCGYAYILDPVDVSFEDRGFNVVKLSCAVGNHTFAHENGHNMGARHDRFVDDTDGSPYDFNHGFVNVEDAWRTFMAYNDACEDAGTSCTRLQYWSNPDLTYGGDPMGIAAGDAEAADNRTTLNNTRTTVQQFRAAHAPTADAGPDQNAECGVPTTLAGSGSCDQGVKTGVHDIAGAHTKCISSTIAPQAAGDRTRTVQGESAGRGLMPHYPFSAGRASVFRVRSPASLKNAWHRRQSHVAFQRPLLECESMGESHSTTIQMTFYEFINFLKGTMAYG